MSSDTRPDTHASEALLAEMRFAFLYTLGEDGLVIRNRMFPDKEAALAAAMA